MAEQEETAILMDLPTSRGIITFVSKTGDAKNAEAFARARAMFENSGGTTAGEGFDALPQGGMSIMRKGFENITAPLRQALPNVGEDVGGIAGTLPLLVLAARAGLISPQAANAPIQAGRAIGKTIADLVSEPLKTPGKAGMAAGTALAIPLTGSVTGATGALRVLPLLRNAAIVGTGGAAGYNVGSLATGGSFDPGKTFEAFALSGLSEGLRSVVGHWIQRYVPRHMHEETAKDIIGVFKEYYPHLVNDPRFMDITAEASPELIARLSSKLGSSLRGSVDDVAKQLIDDIKATLPTALTKTQSDILRQNVSQIVKVQNRIVDALGNKDAVNSAVEILKQRSDDLLTATKNMFPSIKTFEPTSMRIQTILQRYYDDLAHFTEGTQVLSMLKESGINKGWNPTDFAQRIRGEYQAGNTMLERIGNILGGGRPLTEMPFPEAPPEPNQYMRRAVNFMKEQIPLIRHLPGMQREAPTPWPAPSRLPASQMIPSIAVSEGSNAAMQSYLGKSEKK